MNHHGPMQDALIYLAAAVVCVPILSVLRLGSVLGYLVAGCLVGPYLLGFVRDVHAIMSVAELGVVLMLFVIGLELELDRLWTLRRKVFFGGSLQLLVCSLLLFAGLAALGLPSGAALIAAAALSLSSTAIAMQTLAERNLTNTPLGRGVFGVLLFQDLAAIPIIGLVALVAPAAGEPSDSGVVLKGVLAIALVVGIGRFLTRPVLRVIANTGLREVFTAFALLLVLGIAQLMALAGLSMALGAFLAGVLLADSEYRRALETDIEPFKGLLLGLFFMSVGMSIDFGLLLEQPGHVLLLVLGFQALKLLGLWLIAPPLEVAQRQRVLFAALLAQGGEFAFVVFGVARGARALPGQWEGLLTLSVALSMALTPLLLALCDQLAKRDPRNAREADAIESEDAQVIIAGFGRFGQIVGRLLFASGIRATVLDHDPDQIETMRRFGFRVFYGDATRLDLLRAAGADKADVLVNAIDDVEDSLELVDTVREHFPKLEILARARNVGHYVQLKQRRVTVVERETFESALRLGRQALSTLGVQPFEARERVDRFRRHNVRLLDSLIPHFNDEARRLSLAKSGRAELERQFEEERAELERGRGHLGWHSEEQES
jgi:glutathione-regulated potassium-efflux system ancillary protein KefC